MLELIDDVENLVMTAGKEVGCDRRVWIERIEFGHSKPAYELAGVSSNFYS